MDGPKRNKSHPKQDENNKDLPQSPADSNQRLHELYQGYDEQKTNNDQQGDFDVDENDIKERSDEYEDWNRDERPE